MSVAKIGGDRVDHWSIVDRYSYDLPWWKDVVISDNILRRARQLRLRLSLVGRSMHIDLTNISQAGSLGSRYVLFTSDMA